jgi:phage baseplate assembly protein W
MADPAFSQGVGIVGVQFPWSPTGPQASTGIELVNAKIQLVLFTILQGHKMEPTFGSNLMRLVFENIAAVEQLARIEIQTALSVWLPEVSILGIGVEQDELIEGAVNVRVDYLYQGQRNTLEQNVPGSGVP